MLYVGVTNNLQHRVAQHKKKLIPGYTAQYNLFKLVYFEQFREVREAIAREKQLKGWLRARKVALVVEKNPLWDDLAAGWFACQKGSSSFNRQQSKNRVILSSGHSGDGNKGPQPSVPTETAK